MFAALIEEEMKLEAMQRAWQPNFRLPAALVFDENPEITPFVDESGAQEIEKPLLTNVVCNSTLDHDHEIPLPNFYSKPKDTLKPRHEPSYLTLDASETNDFPAQYLIHPVDDHQLPAVGVFVDKKIVPGFKYRVRPLPPIGTPNVPKKYLFDGNGKVLKSIGRGYSRRFTFDDDSFFWSDNRPEGFAFELEVVSEGDKFTVFDANKEAQGTAEIIEIEEKQVEVGSEAVDGVVEKRVRVHGTAKVEFFETGVGRLMPIAGIAICAKTVGGERPAEVKKIVHVNLRGHRYYLTPGFQNAFRRVTVQGVDINDLPTKYTMTGMHRYEIPVVGTYVDPRVIPGFSYRVRPNDRKKHLFNGESLRLLSIGMGYAKRLTFESKSKLNSTNFLWSDNHCDGLGLEPRAVLKGMKFSLVADDEILGTATVFRDDLPQTEETTEKVLNSDGKCSIIKLIQIDVICHIKLNSNERGLVENEQLLRVCGLAVVRKDPGCDKAKVIRVENIGFDSQLKVLFTYSQTELTFIPIENHQY